MAAECNTDGCENDVTEKNSVGHFRDHCWPCIENAATNVTHEAPVVGCECAICEYVRATGDYPEVSYQ